jgi:alpha-glucosidase
VAFLPGVLFLYQGDELGLTNVVIPLDEAVDPLATRNDDSAQGRDSVRTPFPWSPGPGLGFTTGRPWLTDAGRNADDTVEHQSSDPRSPLALHRRLIEVRRNWRHLDDPVVWARRDRALPPSTLSYQRGPIAVTMNCGTATVRIPALGTLLYASGPGVDLTDGILTVEPDRDAVLLTA